MPADVPPSRRKRCVVAYATPAHQHLWCVELPEEATVAQALACARGQAEREDPGGAGEHEPVPWDSANVGIFGEIVSRSDIPRDGDRVELYRPLPLDPKEMRRRRLRQRR